MLFVKMNKKVAFTSTFLVLFFLSFAIAQENITNITFPEEEMEYCGDGICQEEIGENCETCYIDCGVCQTCGDTFCQSEIGETCETCPADCGDCPTEGQPIEVQAYTTYTIIFFIVLLLVAIFIGLRWIRRAW
jgi:hypothetical protein